MPPHASLDPTPPRALVAQTLERFGQIDVLVNNAALYAKLAPVKVTDRKVSWSWNSGPAVLAFDGAFTSDTAIKGEITVRGFSGSFTATKQQAP